MFLHQGRRRAPRERLRVGGSPIDGTCCLCGRPLEHPGFAAFPVDVREDALCCAGCRDRYVRPTWQAVASGDSLALGALASMASANHVRIADGILTPGVVATVEGATMAVTVHR